MNDLPSYPAGETSDGCINLSLVGDGEFTIRTAPPEVLKMIAKKYGHLLTETQRENYRRLDPSVRFSDDDPNENDISD